MSTPEPSRLFIGSIAPQVTEYTILKTFQPYGSIKNIEYAWFTKGPRKGLPRGFAFVEYETEQEARRAIQALNNVVLGGRPIVVSLARDQPVQSDDEYTSTSLASSYTRTKNCVANTTTMSRPRRSSYRPDETFRNYDSTLVNQRLQPRARPMDAKLDGIERKLAEMKSTRGLPVASDTKSGNVHERKDNGGDTNVSRRVNDASTASTKSSRHHPYESRR
ncbi:hypothetical protein SeMB42_g04851 [Synchytrium endobioticum]|uniref:RRM domain-containing protein n=1 Tax=Synchytrium endobioticum TaxID=286115 RepID=A0A507CU55_9FUNG|nr:hypothetical protein SeLEV6574_g05458 [Synchytrium endobioticum]TPX43130.1 hypothetical protein SeMB42_g04851 [Synchytrium endobioticum]